jgi:hypothetical protein
MPGELQSLLSTLKLQGKVKSMPGAVFSKAPHKLQTQCFTCGLFVRLAAVLRTHARVTQQSS